MRPFAVYIVSIALASLALTGIVRASGTPPASPVPVPPTELVGAVPVSMVVRNDGDTADVLVGGVTPAADRVALHATRVIDGQREMHAVPDGIVIPPHTILVLEPGANHLMLAGLREPLVQGGEFPLTLRFEHAGEMTIRVRVRRKVDAAGLTPIPPVTAGGLSVSLASAPPAPA